MNHKYLVVIIIIVKGIDRRLYALEAFRLGHCRVHLESWCSYRVQFGLKLLTWWNFDVLQGSLNSCRILTDFAAADVAAALTNLEAFMI